VGCRYPKAYAEKIMLVEEGQVTPYHFHFRKTEDIINRGGASAGILRLTLHNSTTDGGLADTPVRVSCDGVAREIPAGGIVDLGPGESITLVPGLYHTFTAVPGCGPGIIGEISSVNDDSQDNRFLEPRVRFPAIENDVPPLHLLVGEYPATKA